MVLADKIINLRKKNGLSQEELAEQIGVSRQAVSKWEGMQSIPDLDKLIALSRFFGVSTDYLLNDELEEEFTNAVTESEPERKKVTMTMANDYIDKAFNTAKLIALAVAICILSPVPLIICGQLSEMHVEKELLLCMIGLIVMVVMVAIAVALFIITSNKVGEYKFLAYEIFETEYGVSGMVKTKKTAIHSTCFTQNLIGIIIIVLSIIPLFVGLISDNDLYAVIGLAIMFFIVAIGVFLIVLACYKNGALMRLLQEGDYSKKYKKASPISKAVSSCYFGIATIIYLVWSFLSNDWHITWLVWVVAGILSAVMYPLLNIFLKNK